MTKTPPGPNMNIQRCCELDSQPQTNNHFPGGPPKVGGANPGSASRLARTRLPLTRGLDLPVSLRLAVSLVASGLSLAARLGVTVLNPGPGLALTTWGACLTAGRARGAGRSLFPRWNWASVSRRRERRSSTDSTAFMVIQTGGGESGDFIPDFVIPAVKGKGGGRKEVGETAAGGEVWWLQRPSGKHGRQHSGSSGISWPQG